MSPIEKGHKRDQFNHTMIKVLGSTPTVAPISIKELRSKDLFLQACGFYKPFKVDLYDSYAYEHKVGHPYDGRPSTTQYTPQYEKSTFCLAQRNRNRRQEDRSGRGFNERFNSFTPLNAPVDHIFMQIMNDPALKWPSKLLTDPDKRPRDKYCRFHRDHGHNIEDCYDLKRQIEELIKQGKLQRFIEKGQREGRPQGARQQRPPGEAPPRPPLGEIHVITRGMAAGGTSQEDACKVFHPHDDALVVTMEIAGYSTRRVLIDNGSSADIVYLTAFQQMKIDKDQLQPIETPLVGFASTSIYLLGVTSLQDHCSHDDMPSISTNVITHKLNVNPSTTSVKQKRRVFAPERNAAVVEEVDKLLKAGFIREVYYPEWLANVVMVKKSMGKWRICVDFTDLNKACPKDSYPLPRIDQLVDSTAGHKLLSFMDAFSGYNQIQMTEGDQEKTAFITSRGLLLLQGNALRPQKYWSHLLEIGKQDVP
uniref:Reverse transcriptase domain-containing protein n=1 Tax=Fagus sylvatica TaxID=28930 RepID=A0A2N9FYU7_FAGSY